MAVKERNADVGVGERQPSLGDPVKQLDAETQGLAAVNQRVASVLGERFRAESALSRAAERALSGFSASQLSATERAAQNYVTPAQDVAQALQATMSADLAALHTAAKPKGLALKLSAAEVADLGLHELVDGGVPEVRASAELAQKLSGIILDRIDGQNLARTDNAIIAECRARLAAKRALAAVARSTGGEDTTPSQAPGAGTAAPDVPDVPELVAGRVRSLVESASPPEDPVVFEASSRAVAPDVDGAIKAFSLRSGPADVTAYHDFHDLQIAFRHVWTELFDGSLAKQGQTLYEEVIRLQGLEVQVPDRVDTVDQLRQLKADLERARLKIAAQDPRYQSVVSGLAPTLSARDWARLDEAAQRALAEQALNYNQWAIQLAPDPTTFERNFGRPMRKKAAEQIRTGLARAQSASRTATRVEAMLADLEERLRERYTFRIFAPNSMNYGMLVTYRQAWTPLSYQVGDLVKTMPLAPKESQKYSVKHVERKRRNIREIEQALSVRRQESEERSRMTAEIVRQATNTTNFRHTAEGGVNFAVWNAKGSHTVAVDAARRSATTKKEFRDAVTKSAEEYRQDNRLDVSTTDAATLESVTSGEIVNPNDEISVTYLFYELERRYEVDEKIHKLTPVILIANEVPRPDEIDEDWLLAHDWILRRVVLDDSFVQALDYLKEGFVGDAIATDILRHQWETQLEVVDRVTHQVARSAAALEEEQRVLDTAVGRYAASLTEESGGLFGAIGDLLFGGDTDDTETLRVKLDAAKEAFSRAEQHLREARSSLGREVTALEAATERYSSALKEQFDRRTEVLRLRAHVKDNILYYMQAIWDQEPPDQRFFRLYHRTVKDFQLVPEVTAEMSTLVMGQSSPSHPVVSVTVTIPPRVQITERQLVEVADLDNLLGYKGNYMIFPLRINNPVTLFMMQDYLDLGLQPRLRDPDELGEYSVSELIEMAKCHQELSGESIDEASRERLRGLIIERLMDAGREPAEVVVPSGSLYIEALPGTHPVLEDFKLAHRVADMKRAQSDVRQSELENVRYAARILAGDYGDPQIDRRVVIQGNTDTVVDTGDGGM